MATRSYRESRDWNEAVGSGGPGRGETVAVNKSPHPTQLLLEAEETTYNLSSDKAAIEASG